jgi:O-antigen/teichoic acid export membrane protein
VLRDFFIYGLGGAASRLAAVFLVPLYTRTLSPSSYGELELLLSLQALFVLIVGLQGESAVLRDYFAARDGGDLPQLAWGGVIMMVLGIIASAPFAIVGIALGLVDAEIMRFLPLVALLTITAQLVGIQLILVRFSGRPVQFALYSFLDVLITAVISVVLMVGFGWGIWGALMGMTVSKMFVMALAWRHSFGAFPDPVPSRALLRRMITYALPTMPSVLLNWLQTNGTRVILAIFLSFVDVALASVAIRVAALFGFLLYSFRLAWEPWAFRQLDLAERDANAFNRLLCQFALVMLVPAAGAIVLSPVAVAIFAPRSYAAAASLLGFFVLGQYWLGIANITSIGVHGARVTSRLTVIFGAGGLINVALLAMLAPIIGVVAAAISFFAGAIVSAFIATWLSEHHFATGFSWRILIVAGAVSAVFAVAAWLAFGPLSYLLTAPSAPWPNVAFVAACGLVAIGTVYLIGLSKAQRTEINGQLRGYRLAAKSAMAGLRKRPG